MTSAMLPLRTSWRLVGILGAAAGLAVGELLAGFVGPDSSPYFAVAAAVADLTPRPVKDAAIGLLGPADKLLLLAGLALVLGVCAALVGQLTERAPRLALAAIACLGAIGMISAVTRPDARPADVLPSLVAAVVAGVTMRGLGGLIEPGADDTPRESGSAATPSPAEQEFPRRRLLVTGGLVAAGAVSTAVLGRWLASERFGAARSRAGVRLPDPVERAASSSLDPAASIRGLSRFQTANEDFYRVDTALTVPQLAAEDWELRIHGMVRRPLRLSYQQLLQRPLIERDITLACVSNPVGGPYVGNARWTGARVADLLREVGVDPAADQVVSRSHDGMTIGTPTAALTDGRDAMLAVAMNGEPLPLEHGFPVRMVVPGLYGYVSACKWLVDLELTTFDRYDAYWINQGWAERAAVKTASRIDTPHDGARQGAGLVTVAGVAWAQHRGIDRVEVRVDDGPWAEAELAAVPSVDTWRQWFYRWRAEPGRHRLRVRATDGHGAPQTTVRRDVYPSGATGLHEVTVTIVP
ncbi:MAG TPA: molybdopterin-dependent oxidoreductase [Micromonosporaceae bacterium]